AALPAADGLPLVPVDFRRCRRESCAVAAGPHLTASDRRTTDFTQLLDRRRSDGIVEVIYWEYRPTLGWRGRRPPPPPTPPSAPPPAAPTASSKSSIGSTGPPSAGGPSAAPRPRPTSKRRP